MATPESFQLSREYIEGEIEFYRKQVDVYDWYNNKGYPREFQEYIHEALISKPEQLLENLREFRDVQLARKFYNALCYEMRTIPTYKDIYFYRIKELVRIMRRLRELYRTLPIEQCIHEISIKWERAGYTWAVGLDDRKVRYRLGGANVRCR